MVPDDARRFGVGRFVSSAKNARIAPKAPGKRLPVPSHHRCATIIGTPLA